MCDAAGAVGLVHGVVDLLALHVGVGPVGVVAAETAQTELAG